MTGALSRLLAPKHLAVAGGAWADAVISGNRRLGFRGEILHIHPNRNSSPLVTVVPSVSDLPWVPDCVGIGISNEATIEMIGSLAEAGAGGAVCFASGFSELNTSAGHERTQRLVAAAGGVPFLGPNCYGFINYLDRVAVWPDQIGGKVVDRGVTLICQSGAVAFTLMSQHRSLPIAHLVSIGNQVSVKVHDLIREAASDDRVTAIGMYIESIADIGEFISAVAYAQERNIPIALVKSGRSEAAAKVALTHTASMSGADEIYDTLFEDLGIARCASLSELVETLKLLATLGPLTSRAGVLISGCSGGDMAMTADLADGLDIDLTPISEAKFPALRTLLGNQVSLTNPFDFQTFIWPHDDKILDMFSELGTDGHELIGLVIDHPDPAFCDISSYEGPLRAFLKAAASAGVKAAAITSLPETFPERLRNECMSYGVVPLQGLPDALRAIHHAKRVGVAWNRAKRPLKPHLLPDHETRNLKEAHAKSLVASFGIPVPKGHLLRGEDIQSGKADVDYPAVLKISSADLLHKTEVGGVILGLEDYDCLKAAHQRLRHLGEEFLLETMVTDAVAEIVVGAHRDEQFGLVMVIGSGGIFTELLRDTVHILLPVRESDVRCALEKLRTWPLLNGFRGRPKGDSEALVSTLVNVGRFLENQANRISYLEMNPILIRPEGYGVVAVDVVVGEIG